MYRDGSFGPFRWLGDTTTAAYYYCHLAWFSKYWQRNLFRHQVRFSHFSPRWPVRSTSQSLMVRCWWTVMSVMWFADATTTSAHCDTFDRCWTSTLPRCSPTESITATAWCVVCPTGISSGFRWRNMLSPGQCVALRGPPAPPNYVAGCTGCLCGNASTTGSHSSLSRHDALATRST